MLLSTGDDDSFDFSANAPSIKRGSVLSLGNSLYSKGMEKNNSSHLHNTALRHSVLTPPRSPEGMYAEFDTSPGKAVPALDSQGVSPSESDDDISIDFPFVRAVHSFNPASLSSGHHHTVGGQDPSLICAAFEESDVALVHSIHSSGWGDATLLSTGRRGWIPTNYFVPYADPKAVPLLSVVLNFVLNPKNYEIHNHPNRDQKVYTFSQASITNIVSGVRSLLEACGTLTRDTAIVRRSLSIRKFRKALLTEVAILVSVAKQKRNSTDDAVIEKLVSVCFRIVTKAVMFLDIWAIDTNINDEFPRSVSPTKSPREEECHSIRGAAASVVTVADAHAKVRPRSRRMSTLQPNQQRESVLFHNQPPMASQRLDEVNEALTTYLGVFIHRMSLLESDATASTQILVNTRKSMLACRELLATVESVSSRSLPRNRDLERSKDKLFGQIRGLVTAAREVVSATAQPTVEDINGELGIDPSEGRIVKPVNNASKIETAEYKEKLVEKAAECARTAGECVVRCRNIINKVGDFQLPSTREYPDFSDEVIAVPFYRRDSAPEVVAPQYAVAPDDNRKSLLPHIPSLSPIIPAEVSPTEPRLNRDQLDITQPVKDHAPGEGNDKEKAAQQVEETAKIETIPLEQQIIYDDSGKIRGGTIEGLIAIMTDESKEIDQFVLSTFFLTFRLFTSPERVVKALILRYSPETNEDVLDMQDLEDLSGRRVKVFNFIKRWMESHWKQSEDASVLNILLELAENHFPKIIPNGNLVIRNLASKLASNSLAEGEPIVPRLIALPGGNNARLAMMQSASSSTTSLTKHQVSILQRANEESGFYTEEYDASTTEDETRSLASSAWTPSLKMRHHAVIQGVSVLDFEPMEIASQLTLIDSELYCQLRAEEFLNQNFAAKNRRMGLAPHVVEITNFANQLSAFVGDSILGGDVPVKTRRTLLKQWIKIAGKCYELNNFNSLLSIMSALQSVNILRLKKVWDLLSARYHNMFQELRQMLMPDKNFSNYRTKMRNQAPPCVPHLGLYLTDLTFIEEGNSKFKILANAKVVNFDRYQRTTKLIGEIQKYQVPYRLAPSKELQVWLRGEMKRSHQLITKDHNAMWRRSCIVEPKS